MKICCFSGPRANDRQVGIVQDDRIVPVGAALIQAGFARTGYTMAEIIDALANQSGAMDCMRDWIARGGGLPLDAVRLRAPIDNPPAIWAAAANYRAHQEEMKERVGSYDRSALSKDDLMAEFFLKPASSIIGPNGTVVLPKISNHVDFECELCAVIGAPARKVSEANALEHVFGYTILWDFSQRDPWSRGRHNTRNIRKGFDTFTGLGPWIVTRDEITDPQDLRIVVQQNGAVVMRAHTADMICTLRDHIRFLSGVLTLHPGTLITTGTPAGVSRLAAGDRLTGRIDGIGEMSVGVAAE